jgi:hypothetical protein
VTTALRARIESAATPEEAAAIVAALEALRVKPEEASPGEALPDTAPGRSWWRLAGLLGHPPREVEQEDSLWSYTRWEDLT